MLAAALAVLATLLVGAGVAVETPTNALLGKASGSPLWASLFSFGIGTLVLGIAAVLIRPRMPADWMQTTPWYAWAGGLYGAFVVLASAWATPKLGAGTTLVLIVAGQMALGLALDHMGVLGLAQHPASWLRLVGLAVVVAGAAMIAKG